MRHSKRRYQLGRFTSWHDATITSLAKNMVISQSMKTTLVRAKASRQLIEKLVSLGKENTLAARRRAQEVLGQHSLVNILFNDIAPRFANRNSGFTRIIALGKRRGDNAEMVIFEFTDLKKKEPKKIKAAKETKTQEAVDTAAAPAEEKPVEQPKKETREQVKEKPTDAKPQKKFMGGIRQIFKKKSDSL